MLVCLSSSVYSVKHASHNRTNNQFADGKDVSEMAVIMMIIRRILSTHNANTNGMVQWSLRINDWVQAQCAAKQLSLVEQYGLA